VIAEVGAIDADELAALVGELDERGLLRSTGKPLVDPANVARVRLSLSGWERWEEIRRGQTGNGRGFIAMKFGDTELEVLVNEVIKPGIEERLGLIIERVDENPRAGVIDNIMRQHIQDAAFVVADLTHGNLGAYWEAGYAEGLGKPVIYICSKEAFGNPETKPHFDVNHCQTVMWENGQEKQFLDQLAATIRNSLSHKALP